MERDKNGNLFIDQPINLFEPMINYLRAKANETPLGPPVKSPHLKEYEARMDFYRMVEFYGMSLGIYPCNIELYRGDVGCADISDYPDCSVTARDWSTFTLQTQGHEREIISFEVVLGNVERMQIGWINESKYVENLSNDKNNGVGEELNSLALDCCRGGFLNQGEFIKLEGLSIGSGSVIRCEQKGCRWFCDGRLVISSIASDDTTHFVNTFHPPGQVNGKDDKIIPSFSGKGVSSSLLYQVVCMCTCPNLLFSLSCSALASRTNSIVEPLACIISADCTTNAIVPLKLNAFSFPSVCKIACKHYLCGDLSLGCPCA